MEGELVKAGQRLPSEGQAGGSAPSPAPSGGAECEDGGERLASENRLEGGVSSKSSRGSAPGTELAILRRRLEVAEQELQTTLRLLKGTFCLGVAAVFGVVLFSVSRSSASLRSESTLHAPLQVVDARGNVLLHIDANGGRSRLRLLDPSGQPAVELGGAPEGGSLTVNSQQTGGAVLMANSDGGQLTITGRQAIPVVWLGTRKDGGTLALWDQTGHDLVSTSVTGWINCGVPEHHPTANHHLPRKAAARTASLPRHASRSARKITIKHGAHHLRHRRQARHHTRRHARRHWLQGRWLSGQNRHHLSRHTRRYWLRHGRRSRRSHHRLKHHTPG